MSKKKKVITYLIIFFILLATGSFAYYRINENINASQKQAPPPQSIKVMTAERKDVSNKLEFSGDILAVQYANIYSRVTGNIERISAEIGDYVSQGKILAVIDKSSYIQTLRQTEGLLNQAKANLANNKTNLERTAELYNKGLSPKGDYDNAETLVKVAEAQVQTAEANYDNAALQLSYCNITAPFGGYITKRFLDRGTLVSSGTTNSIFAIADISRLKIMVNIPEKNISDVEYIRDVIISTDAYPNKEFHGKFRKISQSVDLSTRTMAAEVYFDNNEKLLKPGMFTKIEVLLETHSGALTLPSQCVMKDEKGNYVYSISQDNIAVKKYVQTGIQADNITEIVSGLDEKDKVISTGQELIKENSKVKIVQ